MQKNKTYLITGISVAVLVMAVAGSYFLFTRTSQNIHAEFEKLNASLTPGSMQDENKISSDEWGVFMEKHPELSGTCMNYISSYNSTDSLIKALKGNVLEGSVTAIADSILIHSGKATLLKQALLALSHSAGSLCDSLHIDGKRNTFRAETGWESEHFENMPVAAILTELNFLENLVRQQDHQVYLAIKQSIDVRK